MHFVVLGGNGFIGSHFVGRAVQAGHDVTVVDLSDAPRHPHGRTFRFVQGSAVDLAKMNSLLRSADVLCHFAYSTVPSTANADPIADIEQNLVPLLHLLSAMKDAQLMRILYLSSGGAVYGSPKSLPIPEGHPLHPVSAYGVTKVASENYLGMFAAAHDIRPTIIRPSNPYGVNQGKVGLLGAVTTFLRLLQSDETATIWGDGGSIRDYVHIDDLTELMLASLEVDRPGTYNCGAGVGHSLNALMDLIAEVTGRRIKVKYEPARSFDPAEVRLDIALAQRTFGWAPKIVLADGIRQMATDMGIAVIRSI
jgi:UDP-glucose 4-epimerase